MNTGTITITNISKIATENKYTIDEISNTFRKNLIENAEAPKEEPSECAIQLQSMGIAFAFGLGIATVVTLCVKYNIQF